MNKKGCPVCTSQRSKLLEKKDVFSMPEGNFVQISILYCKDCGNIYIER